MTDSEREMILPLTDAGELRKEFTSLQPTYEDTIAPEADDWEQEEPAS